ncbi:MAG: hypothetical protein E7044_10680 [Lentisphaerae bacterium]|nr:hypothetical protein [Lentisphaerota bacterium]
MLLSVRKFSILAGILLLFAVSGGELADLSRELDYIELSFIHAAMQPEMSENRKNVQTRLQNFHNRLIRFERKLRQKRVPGIPNFLNPAGQLVLEFQQLSFTGNSPRLPRYKGTSLGHYSKAYNEYLRDINSLEGKKTRGSRAVPTLKNIPIDNYRAWLDRRTQEYIQNLRRYSRRNSRSSGRGSGKGGRSNYKASTKTINILERNIVNIANLRLCLVKIAQNKFYKE